MADGDEYTFQWHILGARFRRALDANAGDAGFVAKDFVESLIPFDAQIAALDALHQLVDQDRLRAQLVAAMNQGHALGDVAQIQRFFNRGIAAADHCDIFALVKEAVAGRASGHAFTHERSFRGQTQVTGRRAGGDDECVAGIGRRIAL